MTSIKNDKTLCCSNTCKKRFECNRSSINHIGAYLVEDWSSFGSGFLSNNECKVEYWCGELGNYKMFEPIKNDCSSVMNDNFKEKKSMNGKERLIQNIKDVGKALIEDAENIVNSRNHIRDISITCYVWGDDVHYNVDAEYFPKEFIDRLTKEVTSK